MSITQHIGQVVLNSETLAPEDWSERDGKLFLDRQLVTGDSILLVSNDNDAWASRRIFVGPGGNADLYVHADSLRAPKVTETRSIPPSPTRAPEKPDLVAAIEKLGLSEEVERCLLDIEAEIRGAYEEALGGAKSRIDKQNETIKQLSTEVDRLRRKISEARKALDEEDEPVHAQGG